MDAFEKNLFEIIQKHDPKIKPEEILKWSESSSLWASRNYRQGALWIDRTFQYLDGGLDDVDIEKFIINAYGILVDLPEYLEKKTLISKLLGFESLVAFRRAIITQMRDRNMQIHLLSMLMVQDDLAEFVSHFSMEQIFAITFFRNSYCHPALSAYGVKLARKKGGVVTFDPAKYEAFRKIQPYDEFDLCKDTFEKFCDKREQLKKIRERFWQLGS